MTTIESLRPSLLAGVISLIAVVSLLLHPRIQAALFPAVRLQRLTELAKQVRTSRSVDPLLFWQLRDEFGSGFFIPSSDHTIFRETQELFLPPNDQTVEIADYHAARVESRDYLTPGTNLPPEQYSQLLDQVTETQIPSTRSIFQDENTRLFLTTDKKFVVAFVKPISEMARVYGLYNFPDPDMEGRLWIDVTTFSPDCCKQELQKLTESALKGV